MLKKLISVFSVVAMLFASVTFLPTIADDCTFLPADFFVASQTNVSVTVGDETTVGSGVQTLPIDLSQVGATPVSVALNLALNINDDFEFSDDAVYCLAVPAGLDIKSPAFNVEFEKDGEAVVGLRIEPSADGKTLVFRFDSAVMNSLDSKVADITLRFDLDIDYLEDNEQVVIQQPFSEEDNFEITFIPQYPVNGQDEKTGRIGHYEDGAFVESNYRPTHIEWSLRVNDRRQTVASASVSDEFQSDNHHIEDISDIKVYKVNRRLDGSDIDKVLVAADQYTLALKADGKGFDLSFNNPIEDTYVIEYVSKVDQEPAGTAETHYLNGAETLFNGTPNEIEQDKPLTGTWGTKSDPIKKSSSHTLGTETISWEIQYNYGRENLDNVSLTDILSQGSVDLDSVVIEEVHFDRDDNIIGYTPLVRDTDFTVVHGADNLKETIFTIDNSAQKAYRIKYNSTVPLGINGRIENEVTDTNETTTPGHSGQDVNTIPKTEKLSEQLVDEAGNPYVIWTVTINKNKLNAGGVHLFDVFDADLMTLDPNSFVLLKDGVEVEDFQTIGGYTIELGYEHEDGRKGFEFIINNAGSSTYKLQYKTTYTAAGLLEEKLANEAEVFFKTGSDSGNGGGGIGDGGTWVPGEGMDVEIGGPNPGIAKSGSYTFDASGEYINWTMTLNNSRIKLDQPIISDRFDSSILTLVPDTIKVYTVPEVGAPVLVPSSSYDIVPVSGEESPFDAGFNIKFKGNVQDKLMITYTTQVDSDFNNTVHNKASLNWQGIPREVSSEVGQRQPGVTKTGDFAAYDEVTKEKINKWKIDINGTTPTVVYDFSLVDTFIPVDSDLVLYNGNPWVAVYKFVNNVRTLLTEGVDYELVRIAKGSTATLNGVDYAGPGFRINIAKLENVKYELEYYTSYSAVDELQDAENSVLVNYRGLDRAIEKNPVVIPAPDLNLVKTGKLVNAHTPDRQINWTINVNHGSSPKHRVNLSNAFLEDLINDDQKLIPDSIKVYRGSVAEENLLSGVVVLKNNDEDFTVNLPDGPYQYVVTFSTKIIEFPSVDNNDTYSNTATVTTLTDTEDEYSVSKTGKVKYYAEGENNNPIKTGRQQQNEVEGDPNAVDRIFWDALVNKDRHTILDAKIKDTLDSKQQFARDVTSSDNPKPYLAPKVYIYDAVDRSYQVPVADTDKILLTEGVHYTVLFAVNGDGNEYFEISFMEFSDFHGYSEKAGQVSNTYVVEYRSELKDNITGYQRVSNSISLSGSKIDKTDNRTSTSVTAEKWYWGSSGTARNARAQIKKVGFDERGQTLTGISFRLQRYASDGTTKLGTPINFDLTDEQGLTGKTGIRAGRYEITEITTLDGFKTLVAPIKVMIVYGEDGNVSIETDNPLWNSRSVDSDIHKEGGIWFDATVNGGGALVIPNARITEAIEATKTWDFKDSVLQKDSTLPEVYFQLHRESDTDGVESVGAAKRLPTTLDKNNQVKLSWIDLPTHNFKGEPYRYFVEEVNAEGEAWTHGAFITDSETDSDLGLVNTYDDTKLTSLKVTKNWLGDTKVIDMARPEEIKLILQVETADGFADFREATLEASEDWTYTFEDLPQFDSYGIPMTYHVVEEFSGDYQSDSPFIVTVEDAMLEDVTITNTYTKTYVPVEKVWQDDDNRDGIRPKEVTIYLLKDGDRFQEVVLNDENEWKHLFTDLETHEEDREIIYTIEEAEVSGYGSVVTGTHKDGFIVSNTHDAELTAIKVSKVWEDDVNRDGIRPEEVNVYLVIDGEKSDLSVTLNEENEWTASFEDLLKYRDEGTLIEYSVEEELIEGYRPELSGSMEDGFTLTNHHDLLLRDIDVEKLWVDDNDRDRLRPEEITVRLYINGEASEMTRVLKASEDWKGSFTDLPVYQEGEVGVELDYTIIEELAETSVYMPQITKTRSSLGDLSFMIENTYQVALRKIDVEKLWIDSNDERHLRPESITVRLYANGIETEHYLELNARNQWQGSFEALFVYEEGIEIEYTIQEESVEHYQTDIAGNPVEGFIISNTVDKPELPSTGMGVSQSTYLGGGMLLSGLGIMILALLRRRRELRDRI